MPHVGRRDVEFAVRRSSGFGDGGLNRGEPMTIPARVVIGTRASPLSLIQTEEVVAPLRAAYPDTEFDVVPMSTLGDRDKQSSLLSMGRGMFVRDIEEALLSGDIDMAVHSAKDVPIEIPHGLTLVTAGVRRDPRDVLVNRWGVTFAELPAGARIGTSSPRRTAQLRPAAGPGVSLLPVRGNVGTRLEKSRGGDYDGVVLAAAGLVRLGKEFEISEYLTPEMCTPDVGQGTLAAEVRSDDAELLEVLHLAGDRETELSFRAERSFLTEMGGGCKSPIAAYARLDGDELHMMAMAASPDGTEVYRIEGTYPAKDPEEAGRRTVEALLDAGAGKVIERP